MRVAHITDVHWMVRPTWDGLRGKRWLGTANLFLRGRRHHFTDEVQQALVDHVLGLRPDLVIVTGDLTAQALPEEFAKAKRFLTPVLEAIPTFIIPGNHDVYTATAAREKRICRYFGDWMGLCDHGLPHLTVGDTLVAGLDPTRPGVLSSGLLPIDQLEQLEHLLASEEAQRHFVFLAIHYPLLDRYGHVYDNVNHGLVNAQNVIDVLRRSPHPVGAILHGHVHHGFTVDLSLDRKRRVPLFNPGSSGYAYLPHERRAAAMNLYTVSADRLEKVERFLYDGAVFTPEPGGAYATGR